jgi:hypothetical protein
MSAPANDNFAAAAEVSIVNSTYVSASIDNTEATVEPGEPNPTGAAAYRTLWWKYTPLSSGTALIDTVLTARDTEMAVYTGSSVTTLTKLASDADSGAGASSIISNFPVTGGTTYYIQVSSWNNQAFSVVLRVDGPNTAVPPPLPSTVIVADNFTRANSTTTVGAPSERGPAPTVLSGVGGISSNTLYAASPTLLVAWEAGTVNVKVSYRVSFTSSTSSVSGVIFGAASATDHYLIQFMDPWLGVYRYNPGGYVQIGTSYVKPTTSAATDVAGVYRDSVIYGFINGVEVIRHPVDTPITNTRHGLRVTASGLRLDNLLIEEQPTIVEPPSSGAVETTQPTAANRISRSAFLYRGRDSKALDIAGGA